MIDIFGSNQTISFLLNLDFVFQSLKRVGGFSLNESSYNVSLYFGYANPYLFQINGRYLLGDFSTYLYPPFTYAKIETWSLSELKSKLNNSLSKLLDAKFGSPGIVLYDDNETSNTFAFANVSITPSQPLLISAYTELSYWVENNPITRKDVMEQIYLSSNRTTEVLIPLPFVPATPKVYDVSLDVWLYYSSFLPRSYVISSGEDVLSNPNMTIHVNDSFPILYANESFGDFSEFQATMEPMGSPNINVSSVWLNSYYQQETEILAFQINITRPGLVFL